MSEIRAIIFDCDGVLVDSEPISNRVLVEMVTERGGAVDLDFAFQHFKGNSLKNCIELISTIVEVESKEAFEKEFRTRSFKAFEKEIQPVRNVEQVISELRIPYAVASSGPQHKIELNLKLTGLMKYFGDRIFSCYTIQKWKPEPDVFLWAAKELNVNPKNCLVVEDSLFGIQAAVNGGFKVCGFDPFNNDEALLRSSDFVIDDMLKLSDYI